MGEAMTDTFEHKRFHRLEDCIQRAKSGERVQVEVDLRIEKIMRTAEQRGEECHQVDGYLFVADFVCTLHGCRDTISKVYSLSYLTGKPEELHVDRQIANARLKMDYTRLQEAGIDLNPTFFPEDNWL